MNRFLRILRVLWFPFAAVFLFFLGLFTGFQLAGGEPNALFDSATWVAIINALRVFGG